MDQKLLQLEEPQNYFKGIGAGKIPTPTDLLLFLRTSREKLQQEALQNRSHHRFVLILNLKTKGHVHLNHRSLPFSPGQALLVLPYQFHHFGQLESGHLKWLFCTFELEPQTFLEPLRNRTIHLTKDAQSALEDLLRRWHQPPGELQAHQLQAALMRLLLSLSQERQRAGNDLPPEPKEDLIRTINRLMAERRGQTVLAADLARALELSESRLRVLFKEAAGIPIGGYIQNYRINRAMALLRTSDLSIAEVAEESSFGSPQAFSRIFKKTTGQTPRAYRLRR